MKRCLTLCYLVEESVEQAEMWGGIRSEDPRSGVGPVHGQRPLAVVPQRIWWGHTHYRGEC